jgi:adenosine deaminase
MAEHPLDRLLRAGVAVLVNTDDPCLLGVTLLGEYASCVDAYGGARLTCAPWRKTSIEASFTNAETKARLIDTAAGQW